MLGRRSVAIIKILLSELDAEEVELQGPNDAWKFVPRDEFVDHAECPDPNAIQK